MAVYGIIGGSGLYQMDGLRNVEELEVTTPYGPPSDRIFCGQLGDVTLCFLPRHGRNHTLPPSEINFRANIFALKTLGVEQVISVSAVGSLQQQIAPGHMVIVDQFIDFTRASRPHTFFEAGITGHVSMADPTCHCLRQALLEATSKVGVTTHSSGTYICMEGPQFSSRAESHMYRQWGADIVGMTNMPEAKLAREAELCYATLALSTDYDCWKEDEEHVSVDMVLEVMHQNVSNARRVLAALAQMPPLRDCSCSQAAATAIITPVEAIAPHLKEKLAPLYKKYWVQP
ncbi:S-methyl-5'-thioadenosine phosphorylase [Desulfurispira natronophila]|uniref:S-methyl-5'-thioadenosine phosphorylase n=1 Tax=Desulfurispira natronophila TaxID=682562 RepID=A0A7W7Y3P6_9BACT|nr:S-methyl-5'-thioadenosine phosphorylase [Desulfurispira natronophila]MBB5021508.1 5'-methylthioadenosine phosphorylase [Desulfurispira natronophila]